MTIIVTVQLALLLTTMLSAMVASNLKDMDMHTGVQYGAMMISLSIIVILVTVFAN